MPRSVFDSLQWPIDPVALLLLGVLVIGILALLSIGELKVKHNLLDERKRLQDGLIRLRRVSCDKCGDVAELCPYGLCSTCCECH